MSVLVEGRPFPSFESRYILTLDISRSISVAMKHDHHRHRNHPHHHPDHEVRDHGRGRHHRHHYGERHGGRLFDYGELRLLVLAMIAEQPRHGYELMKAIEERMSGSYSPSPGVIYPTLSWLEDMGYTTVESEGAGRKRYQITSEGEAFITANRAAIDALLARMEPAGEGGREETPAPVRRGFENLKFALRLRLKRGPLDQAAAELIAAALDTAAQAVERS
jgi:DNA-binding PadR family transcriptional regulator